MSSISLSRYWFVSGFSVFAFCCLLPLIAKACQDSELTADELMVANVLRKVEENPEHSDSWRMLGKICHRLQKNKDAILAFRRAIQLMPENSAAHYDLGNLLITLGHEAEGAKHLQQVADIAPQSEYGQRVMKLGFRPSASSPDQMTSDSNVQQAVFINAEDYLKFDPQLVEDSVEQVSYEISTFDGAGKLDRSIRELQVENPASEQLWQVFVETGALYNSNVTLSPIRRDFELANAASPQWFANTELEWVARRGNGWKFGPLGRGYFTVNESTFSQFDLASFQTGAFAAREALVEEQHWISRLHYLYSIDLFGGESTGDRHLVTTSLTKIDSAANVTYCYASIASTQFVDDGTDPSVTSLDGTTYSAGVSRLFLTSNYRLPIWSLGLDWELADVEGADFLYHSLRAHGDTTMTLATRLSLRTSCGLGFRLYPDFTGPVERDELTYRLAAQLQYQINPYASLSLVTNYDRFVSDNQEFDVHRFTAGIISTLQY